jgi:hypothetical protein
MDLPLPKTVADVGPGGPLVTAMQGMNALTDSGYQNEINKQKAKYAHVTVPAEAASKLAYANLMGPQFLAKLMGNTDILANMSPEQRTQALALVQQAGSGQGTGNAMLNSPYLNQSQSGEGSSPFANFVNSIKSALGLGGNPQSNNQPPQNPMLMQGGNNDQGTNSLNQSPVQPMSMGNGNLRPASPELLNHAAKSPENYQNAINNGWDVTPIKNQVQQQAQPSQQSKQTFPENVGEYKGIVEEGTESGKIRAKDIEELNNNVFNGEKNLTTLKDLGKIVSSPAMKEMRNLPLLGNKELAYYAKEGTPAQQDAIGKIRVGMGNIVKDSAGDFKGQFRQGEQQLLQTMKPNESDTVNVMLGKLSELTKLQTILSQRSRLTSQIMSKEHVNKLEALDKANKILDSGKIDKDISNDLYPEGVPGENKGLSSQYSKSDIEHTAKKYNMSVDQVKAQLDRIK